LLNQFLKNGDKQLVNNYRPISLISNLAKIYEKVVKSRLMAFKKIINRFGKINIALDRY